MVDLDDFYTRELFLTHTYIQTFRESITVSQRWKDMEQAIYTQIYTIFSVKYFNSSQNSIIHYVYT